MTDDEIKKLNIEFSAISCFKEILSFGSERAELDFGGVNGKAILVVEIIEGRLRVELVVKDGIRQRPIRKESSGGDKEAQD